MTAVFTLGVFFAGNILFAHEDSPQATAEGVKAPDGAQRTVELGYHLTVEGIPEEAERITAWVPLPPSTPHQKLESYRVEGDWSQMVADEPEYGNRFLHLDLSPREKAKTNNLSVTVFFRVTRQAYRATESQGEAEGATPVSLARFLSPDRLIPINGIIAEEALRVAGSTEGALEKARKLYDHIVSTVSYDKSGEGWGRGDALYACDVRKGNCTDFHSLFIGEARALGIPSRFIMGIPLPENSKEGTIPGYHCWAEFYVEGLGWVPIDASEAHKHPEKKDFFFGGLDANRIEFSTGRDVKLPMSEKKVLNYSIYPYVEIDRKPHTAVKTWFTFREM